MSAGPEYRPPSASAAAAVSPENVDLPGEDATRWLGRGHDDGNAGAVASQDAASGVEDDPARAAAQAPVVRFVADVLTEAVRRRAADVHFEPGDDRLHVRQRIDGTLRETATAPGELRRAVLARLKVLANLDLAEQRRPQDGRVRFRAEGREVDLRVATLPTESGEAAVVRVLGDDAGTSELSRLGLPESVESGLLAALARPHGLVVVTGPTGSGKTTTLYACLRRLDTPDVKILTIEDPVECELAGAVQVPVNPAAGLTFARALRAFLRQDPDLVMVGEIRDPETAHLAVQAALTGHLVLATLHTNDAPTAVTRLVDLGIEPFLLAATLEAVVAQRLVRRVCSSCRTWRDVGGDEVGDPAAHFVRVAVAAGCPACDGTGHRGRLGLFEFLAVDESFRAAIAAGATLEELRTQARVGGWVPLRTSALERVRAGDTTVEEIRPLL